MKNWWIKFGCFLIGYNYNIVKVSSEVTAKSVKRYTSAILIVSLVWAFIGFAFTQRYLHGSLVVSIVGAMVAVFMIVQIERQIILVVHASRWLYASRALLAVMMAIIGAVIIDQIIFKEDIELAQISLIDKKVDDRLPKKSNELRMQIAQLDSAIANKEYERSYLIADITKNPTIRTVSSNEVPVVVANTSTDSLKVTKTSSRIIKTNNTTISSIQNPKMAMIEPLDLQIKDLRNHKSSKDSLFLTLRPQIESEIKSKIGFLDELNVMYSILSNSIPARVVYGLWFLFLLGIELLVLVSKANDKKNDYEQTILHHMNIQFRKLELLAKMTESKEQPKS